METQDKNLNILDNFQALSKKVDEFETKHIYYTPALEEDYKELQKDLEELKDKCDRKQLYFITKRIETVINKFRKPILPIGYITDAVHYEGQKKLFYNPIYNRFFDEISHRRPFSYEPNEKITETVLSIQKLKDFFGVDNNKYILEVIIPEIYYTINFREDSNYYMTVRLYGRKSAMMVKFEVFRRYNVEVFYQPEPLLYRESNFELQKLLKSKYKPELSDNFSISVKEIRDTLTSILHSEGTYDFYPNFNTDTKDVMRLLDNKMYYINLANREYRSSFEYELKDDETILFKNTYNSRRSCPFPVSERLNRFKEENGFQARNRKTAQTKTFTVEDYCNEIGMEHILKYWDEKYNGNKKPNEVEYLYHNRYFFRCPKCGSLNGVDLGCFSLCCDNNICHDYRKSEIKTIAYNLSKHFDIKTHYQPKWCDISPFNIFIENINYKNGDKVYKNVAVQHKYIVSNDAITKLEIKQCQDNDTFVFFIATQFGCEIPLNDNIKIFYCNELFDDSEEGMKRAITKLLAELGIVDAEINANQYSSIIQDFAISNEPQKEIDQENNTEEDVDFGDIETIDDFVEFDPSSLDEIPAPPAVNCGE